MNTLPNRMKRVTDIVLAALGLLVLSLALVLLAMVVWLDVGSPVLFRQKRTGLHGRIFRILKFRTMRNETHRDGRPLGDGERLTRFGQWLRRTSLDELPELWNVLRGDMSLVGPRPLLPAYLDRYTPRQARRHEVKPGISGWAQVNGRNAVSWEERFEMDVWYVENQGLWLDLRIMLLSGWTVLRRDGIAAPNHSTMPEFLGTKPTQCSDQQTVQPRDAA